MDAAHLGICISAEEPILCLGNPDLLKGAASKSSPPLPGGRNYVEYTGQETHQPSAPGSDYLCLQRPLAIQASLGRKSGTKAGQKLRKLSRCSKEFGETGLLILLNTYLHFQWEMLTVIFE